MPVPSVHVQMLPALFEPADLLGGVAVVIDVLRASTVMITALDHGAVEVLPTESVDEARCLATEFTPDRRLLGGERHSRLIEGFDLDNSPRAYTRERVAGRSLIFTTTNGTRALHRASQADRVLVGAFANLSAIVNALRKETRPVHLVCAGTDGQLTAEDILFAGMVARDLLPETGSQPDLPTEMAIRFAEVHGRNDDTILETLRESVGGRNLIELGMDADIAYAALRDRTVIVPEYQRSTGRITAAPA